MNDFLKMDVFFAVTMGAVVILVALLAAALLYAIRVLRAADRIAQKAEREAGLLSEDLRKLQASIRAEGFKWKLPMRWWRRVLGGRSKPANFKN